jgi:hypothetical protein
MIGIDSNIEKTLRQGRIMNNVILALDSSKEVQRYPTWRFLTSLGNLIRYSTPIPDDVTKERLMRDAFFTAQNIDLEAEKNLAGRIVNYRLEEAQEDIHWLNALYERENGGELEGDAYLWTVRYNPMAVKTRKELTLKEGNLVQLPEQWMAGATVRDISALNYLKQDHPRSALVRIEDIGDRLKITRVYQKHVYNADFVEVIGDFMLANFDQEAANKMKEHYDIRKGMINFDEQKIDWR